MDAKVSIKTKTKTIPIQNLFRYITFKNSWNLKIQNQGQNLQNHYIKSIQKAKMFKKLTSLLSTSHIEEHNSFAPLFLAAYIEEAFEQVALLIQYV